MLVTFSSPSVDPKLFKAHSLDIIKKQAEALGLPHAICFINGPDYFASYQQEIKQLAETYGVSKLVTRDILQQFYGAYGTRYRCGFGSTFLTTTSTRIAQ